MASSFNWPDFFKFGKPRVIDPIYKPIKKHILYDQPHSFYSPENQAALKEYNARKDRRGFNADSGYGLNNMLNNKGKMVDAQRTALQRALDDAADRGVTTSGVGGQTTSGGVDENSPYGNPLTWVDTDTKRLFGLLAGNDRYAIDRKNRYQTLLDDKNSYQPNLNVEQLMGMGPQDWANPRKTADERARLQYDPQIKAIEFERANMAKQGLQNRSDISGWYDLVNSAMADAKTKNTADTRGFSDFATDSSKSLMESLGGASNDANAAVASTVQSNNNMINTLGQVQGNYLTNAKLNAQLEGTQQQTNQMRLNDNADRLAAQQILDLQGKQGASASDYRFTMEGQNRDLQSQRLATRAGLLGENSRINAANDLTRLGFQDRIDSAEASRLTGKRSLLGDISIIDAANAKGRIDTAKANIEREVAAATTDQARRNATVTAYNELLKIVLDNGGNLQPEFKTKQQAFEAVENLAKELNMPNLVALLAKRLNNLSK